MDVKWVNPPSSTPEGVQHCTYHSEFMKCDVGYTIYTPSAYQHGARLPVLYYLHGADQNESSSHWVIPYFQKAMESGRARPFLVVFVNGGPHTMYFDRPDGTAIPMRTIAEELVPHIDATFRTIPSRGARAINGKSMGGFGAFRLAFSYPHLFTSVITLAGALLTPEQYARRHSDRLDVMFGQNRDQATWQNPFEIAKRAAEEIIASRLRIRIEIGLADHVYHMTHEFHKHLVELGIPHEYETLHGVDHGHHSYYRAAGDRIIRWTADTFDESPN